ncbi:hypothetical protein MOP88_17610 [Sphingomonas sp. WKB10]|jgi:hypothetical protein|nr:hypothetical protein [Sphingomonas sp. WKB10]
MNGILKKVPIFVCAALVSTSALADPVVTYQPFNDGNGTCGTIACGSYGCSVIETHRCPQEVDPNG